MTPEEHRIQAATWAARTRQGKRNDCIIALLRAQMHAAAATGTFMGDARIDAPELKGQE